MASAESTSKDKLTIFLNYRKVDTQAEVDRLRKELGDRLGAKVFQDVHIQAGDKWRERILQTLDEAKVVLVVIGKKWLTVTEEGTEQRRLDNKEDWVRVEIEKALEAGDSKIVIPVFVQKLDELDLLKLPDSLKPLLDRQIHKQRPEKDWDRDFEDLCEVISKHPLLQPDTKPSEPAVSSLEHEFALCVRDDSFRTAFIIWLFQDTNLNASSRYTLEDLRKKWYTVLLQEYLHNIDLLVELLVEQGLSDFEARREVSHFLKILVPLHPQRPLGCEDIVFEIEESARMKAPLQIDVEVTTELVNALRAIKFPDDGEALRASLVIEDDRLNSFVQAVASVINKTHSDTEHLLRVQTRRYIDRINARKKIHRSAQNVKRPLY